MTRHIRFVLLLLLLALCGAVFATPATPVPTAVLHAVLTLDPGAQVRSVRAGPVPGLYEVSTGRRLLEVSSNGRYVFDGHLFDLQRGVDLATRETNRWRSRLIGSMPASSFIAFTPAHPRFVVTVFTDPSCAYCQIMAGQIQAYLAKGIALRFAAYPAELGTRTGNPILARIWCAADPHQAFISAFTRKLVPTAARDCTGDLSISERIATQLRLPGTPSVIGPHGSLLGGYLSPGNLLAKLSSDAAANAAP